jgi:urocanate hydratase
MLILDGSEAADEKIMSVIGWDVNNGISRRAWSGNENANFVIKNQMKKDSQY